MSVILVLSMSDSSFMFFMYLGFVPFCSLINLLLISIIVLPCNLWLFLWNFVFCLRKMNHFFLCLVDFEKKEKNIFLLLAHMENY